jgi:hypothetical protein
LNADGSVFISSDRPPNDTSETNLEFWPADFYLTQKEGHADLTAKLAVCVYEYLAGSAAATPQPAPTGDSKIVLESVIAKINDMLKRDTSYGALSNSVDPYRLRRVQKALIERAEFGLKKYGTYLRVENGRDARVDELQEILDAIMYDEQQNMQGADDAPDYFEKLVVMAAELT